MVVAAGMVLLLGWPVRPAVLFGVLIAATDPVAVIAMFKDNGVTGRLRLLVESESLFNDGVAAVLFTLVVAWVQATDGYPITATEAVRVLAALHGWRHLCRASLRRSGHRCGVAYVGSSH